VIYIKGFVRAFARAVGLCENWAMQAINALLADRRNATA
jgi:cytoskeletal protein RodZ